MNTQFNARLLQAFFAKVEQLEALNNRAALRDLDRVVRVQLPDAAQLYQRYRHPEHPDDRERITARVIELAAGARFEDLTRIHQSEGL